ncbi:uncharacterized protein LOC143856981 [Tasmannia lanceolata]|uniref:uncharacterized protein LOC143856981 n=1 Tax=Tasmannia lanceolata TaxID=3420 RepID=UPI004064C847
MASQFAQLSTHVDSEISARFQTMTTHVDEQWAAYYRYLSGDQWGQVDYEELQRLRQSASQATAGFAQPSSSHTTLLSSFGSWIIDSGASNHMTGNSSHLSSFRTFPSAFQSITLADGSTTPITSIGTTCLSPNLPLSSDLLTGRTIGSGREVDGLYRLGCSPSSSALHSSVDAFQWHCRDYFSSHSIIHQSSCAYTSQQNGVTERKLRYLLEVARTLLFQMHVSKTYWSDAILSACFLSNRLPSSVLHGDSPFHIVYPHQDSFPLTPRVFSCVCFVHHLQPSRDKLDLESFFGSTSVPHVVRMEHDVTISLPILPPLPPTSLAPPSACPTGQVDSCAPRVDRPLLKSNIIVVNKRHSFLAPTNRLHSQRSLYPLIRFSEAVMRFGLKQCGVDHSVFSHQSSAGCIMLIVYIDDIIITGSDSEGIQKLKAFLQKEFATKDLGRLRYFLGIEVAYSSSGLSLSQRKYVLELLEEIGNLSVKPVAAPMDPNVKLVPEEGELLKDPGRYRRLVGKLIYLTVTRPDISYAVGVISQYMTSPRTSHWNVVVQILKYLKGEPGKELLFKRHGHTRIEGFSDADWVGSPTDRRSTTGYCTFVGGNLVS